MSDDTKPLKIRLIRFLQTDDGTNGVLLLPGAHPLYTVERPHMAALHHGYGVPGQSCIPVGEYQLSKHTSPSFRDERWYISDPPMITVRPHGALHRWGIMFHMGNKPADLQGCIALGTTLADPLLTPDYNPPHTVVSSGLAMSVFNDSMSRYETEFEDIRLVISDTYHLPPAAQLPELLDAS